MPFDKILKLQKPCYKSICINIIVLKMPKTLNRTDYKKNSMQQKIAFGENPKTSLKCAACRYYNIVYTCRDSLIKTTSTYINNLKTYTLLQAIAYCKIATREIQTRASVFRNPYLLGNYCPKSTVCKYTNINLGCNCPQRQLNRKIANN